MKAHIAMFASIQSLHICCIYQNRSLTPVSPSSLKCLAFFITAMMLCTDSEGAQRMCHKVAKCVKNIQLKLL